MPHRRCEDKLSRQCIARLAEMDDCAGPENQLSEKSGTWVRIPHRAPIILNIPAWRNSVAQLPVKERVAGSSPAVGANYCAVAYVRKR